MRPGGETVYAGDLKSPDESRAGSSPAPGTIDPHRRARRLARTARIPAGGFMSRFAAFHASLVLTAASVVMAVISGSAWIWSALVFGAFTAMGACDLLPTRSTLRRNYPILAHYGDDRERTRLNSRHDQDECVTAAARY